MLKVAAFGVGRMGRVHLEHLVKRASTKQVQLVALGDRHAPTLDTAVRMAGPGVDLASIPRFDSPEAMLDAGLGVQGVVVASRTEDHARDALAFARRGVPVLLEKPFANTTAEACDLADALEALPRGGDRLVQVAFNRAFDEAAQAAERWVGDGLIGELQQSHHVLQDKNPTPPSYQSAGITADMAIHLVFEAMAFHGHELPARVQAARFLAPHYDDGAGEGANIVHAFLSWKDGSLAHLWGSRLNVCGYDNGFKLIGTEGRIDVGEFVGDFGPIHARLFRGNGKTLSVPPQVARGTLVEELTFEMRRGHVTPGRKDDDPVHTDGTDHPDFYARFATAYERELDGFLDAIRKDAPFAVPPSVGWKSLFVANLAEASSRQNGKVFDISAVDSCADAREFNRLNPIEGL